MLRKSSDPCHSHATCCSCGCAYLLRHAPALGTKRDRRALVTRRQIFSMSAVSFTTLYLNVVVTRLQTLSDPSAGRDCRCKCSFGPYSPRIHRLCADGSRRQEGRQERGPEVWFHDSVGAGPLPRAQPPCCPLLFGLVLPASDLAAVVHLRASSPLQSRMQFGMWCEVRACVADGASHSVRATKHFRFRSALPSPVVCAHGLIRVSWSVHCRFMQMTRFVERSFHCETVEERQEWMECYQKVRCLLVCAIV